MKQLASDEKLSDNDIELFMRLANCLRVIRQETDGFGGIHCKVQNGLIVSLSADLTWNLNKQKT